MKELSTVVQMCPTIAQTGGHEILRQLTFRSFFFLQNMTFSGNINNVGKVKGILLGSHMKL